MRVMVIVKATKNSEAGVMPSEQLLTAMGKYNEELASAGILKSGEGLHGQTPLPAYSGASPRIVRRWSTSNPISKSVGATSVGVAHTEICGFASTPSIATSTPIGESSS